MDLAITTDYVTNRGDPEPYLRRIAAAGFTHVHWCHEWNTDRLYTEDDVERIARWLHEYDLKLLDLHGSHGALKRWYSLNDQERLAGVELVKNRIDLTARLASHTAVIHLIGEKDAAHGVERYLMPLCKSLDALLPFANARRVKLAIENMPKDDFEFIRELFARYPEDFLGLCYDSGHGNIGGAGLQHLTTVKSRLAAVHLHDNAGLHDSHNLPFSGTVDWNRLAAILAHSSYVGCVSLESNMRGESFDETTYLTQAYESAARFSSMINKHRANDPSVVGSGGVH